MKKTNTNIYNINVIIEGLRLQPLKIKNAYKQRYNAELNDLLIDLLEYVEIDQMQVEHTPNGFNRGVIGENLIKYHIFTYLDKIFNGYKSITNTCDIDLRKYDINLLNDLGLKRSTYEIKTITKVSNAHASAHNNKNYIVLDLKYNFTVALVNSDNLVYDNSGHITGYNDFVELTTLKELLGL